ncbi:MAG: hypothetical protein U5K73_00425 [Halofilum sp. (in: g-proteobacteria)]|nr:hypothetical protein [Halofilum sp. (in: g-proteobacteria)]
MKRVLRSFAVGLLLGGLVGLWFGMNIGKDQPLLSNPFAEVPLAQKAGRAAAGAVEGAKQGAEKAGRAAKSATEAAKKELQSDGQQ